MLKVLQLAIAQSRIQSLETEVTVLDAHFKSITDDLHDAVNSPPPPLSSSSVLLGDDSLSDRIALIRQYLQTPAIDGRLN